MRYRTLVFVRSLASILRIVRTDTTVEVHYAICSVPRSQADAAQRLQWWRGHWGIENRLHWVGDVTFAEDASRIRTKSAPQIFSALRNASISCLRSMAASNIAAALRENALKVPCLLAKPGIL